MTTIGNTSRPAYVYDAETDVWVPIGVGPHTHDEYIDNGVISAKGDILVGTAADTVGILGVGSNGNLLTADSSATNGIAWLPAPIGLPAQTGNAGNLLTTDGTTASWSNTLLQPITANSFSPTSSTIPTNGMYLGATNQVNFATDSTSRVTIANSGTTINDGFLTAARFIPSGSTVPSNGMYLASSNTLGFSTNSTNRLTIDSAGNSTFAGSVTGTSANATLATGATGIGFMGLPQSSDAGTTGSYTLKDVDAGKHVYASATRTVTIPSNSTTAFPIGTTIVFITGSGATMTIAITTDTLLLAGVGTTGSRTLAPFGMATAVKITATSWMISGAGLT
jgi:hypothetical protein